MPLVRMVCSAGLALLCLTGAASGRDAATSSHAARVALVIGNGSYTQAPLGGATSDAQSVADTLREGGFDVIFTVDARKAEFEAAIEKFARTIERGAIAVVYYSGYAVQYKGRNFLLPLDARVASEADVRWESIDVDRILDPLIVARPAGSVVILDASRNNPWQQAIAGRVRGLAAEGPIAGVVLVYAAAPGSVVELGATFPAELVKAMKIPGLSFEKVFRRTRAAVARASRDQQAPWESSIAPEELIITPGRSSEAAPPTRAPERARDPVELGFWGTIKSSDRAADFRAYLESYPEGEFATLARARLKRLGAAETDGAGGAGPEVALRDEALTSPAAPIRDCTQCPEMILIPPGTFEMGSNDVANVERPVHRVSIAKAFYIGRREVMFQEWDVCVSDGGCSYRPDDRGLGRGMRPATDLDWNDAREYAAWLSRKTGLIYRLPSESEWEYAARAGSATTYPWGKNVEKDRANCLGCTAEPLKKAVESGSYPPNAFGLFDMLGNAAEWVEDCWNDSYRGAPADGSVWTKPQCRERVLRGGSFNNDPRYLRSASRFKYDFDVRYYANGFRVAREK
jgi:formylglycine-generating enzyme required for sulfatase activity